MCLNKLTDIGSCEIDSYKYVDIDAKYVNLYLLVKFILQNVVHLNTKQTF